MLPFKGVHKHLINGKLVKPTGYKSAPYRWYIQEYTDCGLPKVEDYCTKVVKLKDLN